MATVNVVVGQQVAAGAVLGTLDPSTLQATVAQDEATSVVFGMPGELVRLRGADAVLPAHAIANHLTSWLAPVAPMRTTAEARHGSR